MKVFPLACAFDNYSYLIVCEKSGLAAVVDPTEAYPVWLKAGELSVTLTKIFCTHHHQDHVGGIADLLEEQPELQVYGYHADYKRIPGVTRPLHHGDALHLGSVTGTVLHTPGHTAGSVCYLFEGNLFTGDTLFGGGCGRLFEGSAEEMYASLTSVIAPLADETAVWFGHEYTLLNLQFAAEVEPASLDVRERLKQTRDLARLDFPTTPSTLGQEKRTNPFLRCGSASFMERAGFRPTTDPVEVFRQLRGRRDQFKGQR